jgi:DNA ligase-1
MEPQWDLELPRLYKKSKTGAIVICDIKTTGDNIKLTTGQLNGEKIDHWTKCYPKNEGKANATTSVEQAQKEAKAKWKKKVKAGYVEDPSGELTVKLPMKVKKYQDQIKNIQFPCWISRKLNGVNGEFRLEDDELKLYSRGGDEYPMLEHMRDEILQAMKYFDTKTLNGEIYKHGMHLQDITSAVKKHNNDTPNLEFHIFEIPDDPDEFRNKIHKLHSWDNSKYNYVKVVRATKALGHDDIEISHEKATSKGYEGIIIRNPDCVYEYNVRSSQVFKYKKAQDAEYKIVGWRADKNGHPVFTCTTGEHEFAVKIKGTDSERKEIASKADEWVGQWLKIEFEELSKDKKPLKPVGLGLRACDEDGNPLE